MTKAASSNSLEEVSPQSPSCSSSTSSTEVYNSPLGQGGEIFVNDEKFDLATIGSLASPYATASNILVSNNEGVTKIGTVDFHINSEGPTEVKINHYAPAQELKGNGLHKNELRTAQNSTHNLRNRFRNIYLPSTIVFLLLLLTISLVVFRESIFSKAIVFPPFNPETNVNISGHPVYYKANWGALDEKESPALIPLPTSVVIISHSATENCTKFIECANRTQAIQYSFLQKGHRDIGYNFLIGGDGGIYVGRGWDNQNSIRAKSLAIAFIGDFNKEYITATAKDAAQALIVEGGRIGKIDSEYKLIGENQTSPLRFYSPGWNLVTEIKKWDHYYSGTML